MTQTPRDDAEDPAYATDIYADLFDKPRGMPIPTRNHATPHGALKKRCVQALRDFSGATGVLIPIQNIQAQIPGTDRKYQTGRVGASDLVWLYRSVAFGIEIKAGRDTVSPKQQVFADRWNAAGGVYLVARSPEQMIAGIEAALRQRGGRA